jgi:hypothetical protein
MRYIGVDLSKRAFTVCFLAEDDSTELVSYSLTEEGLAAFRAQLAADDRLAVEVGTSRVAARRGTGLSASPFPRRALRTGRARYRASGSP